MNLKDQLIHKFEKLSIEKQEEVIDFVEYLNSKQDPTEYLFSTQANREHLEQAISNVEADQNLIEVSLEDLKKGNLPQV